MDVVFEYCNEFINWFFLGFGKKIPRNKSYDYFYPHAYCLVEEGTTNKYWRWSFSIEEKVTDIEQMVKVLYGCKRLKLSWSNAHLVATRNISNLDQ